MSLFALFQMRPVIQAQNVPVIGVLGFFKNVNLLPSKCVQNPNKAINLVIVCITQCFLILILHSDSFLSLKVGKINFPLYSRIK